MDPSEQLELFPGRGCLPAEIVVGPFGIYGDWLARTLGCDPWHFHQWHGSELGSPRDYFMRRRGTFYTAEGVRRILELLGWSDLAQVKSRLPSPIVARPRISAQAAGKGQR